MTETDPRQDISDVLVRYATGIDRRDWPLFRTVFTDDCRVDYGEIGVWNGVDAVTDFMEQTHAMAGHTMHRLTIRPSRSTATKPPSRTYIDAVIMFGDNQRGVNALGFYDDEIVRTADGWRIAVRRFTQVRLTTFGQP